MRKLIMIAILALGAGFADAQTFTKHEDVYKGKWGGIHGITKFISFIDGEESDISYYFYAQNSSYSRITDIVTISSGSLEELSELVDEIIKSFDYNDVSMTTSNSNSIYVSTYGNMKSANVYGVGSDDYKYHYFTMKQLLKIRKAIDIELNS